MSPNLSLATVGIFLEAPKGLHFGDMVPFTQTVQRLLPNIEGFIFNDYVVRCTAEEPYDVIWDRYLSLSHKGV